eukprot:1999810-Pyramimonas_sp.AAC.1
MSVSDGPANGPVGGGSSGSGASNGAPGGSAVYILPPAGAAGGRGHHLDRGPAVESPGIVPARRAGTEA